MSNNQLNDLSKTYLEAVYGGAKKEEPKDTRLVVTAADKKANTKAYQNYKAGMIRLLQMEITSLSGLAIFIPSAPEIS